MILADITEKANGVYFEIGYAKALGLRVVAMCEAGKESSFLKAAADEVVEYGDWTELVGKLCDYGRIKHY
jgi:nucleoside 2-deoxyribosyltransferase